MTVVGFSCAPWPTQRLKYCASYNDEALSESTDDFAPIQYVEISDVSLVGGIETATPMLFHEAPSRARRKVRSGDILVSTVRTYLKAIASVDEAPDDLVVSTGFCVIRPTAALNSSYAGWVVRSEEFVGEVVSRSVGVSYPAINASELMNIEVPLPPLDTQRRIAAFLDENVARIDALIARKQALLERLAEKRQAIITHAITKGLNSAAPMKDSGIDWLGQIPAHWDVLPLGRIVRLKSGDALTSSEIEEEGDYPVYGGNGLRGYTSTFNTQGEMVIVGRQGEHCGNVHRIDGQSFVTEHSLRCFPEKAFNTSWLAMLLETMNLRQHSVSAAQPGLSADRLKMLASIYCPTDEQDEIAGELGQRLGLQASISKPIEASLVSLSEYRSALISAAVTGQIAGLQ